MTVCIGCDRAEVRGAMPETLDMTRPLADFIENAPLCEACQRGLRLLDEVDGPWTIEVTPR